MGDDSHLVPAAEAGFLAPVEILRGGDGRGSMIERETRGSRQRVRASERLRPSSAAAGATRPAGGKSTNTTLPPGLTAESSASDDLALGARPELRAAGRNSRRVIADIAGDRSIRDPHTDIVVAGEFAPAMRDLQRRDVNDFEEAFCADWPGQSARKVAIDTGRLQELVAAEKCRHAAHQAG